MNEHDDMRWAGTWATTPVPVEGMALAGQTVPVMSRAKGRLLMPVQHRGFAVSVGTKRNSGSASAA